MNINLHEIVYKLFQAFKSFNKTTPLDIFSHVS